MKWFRVKFKLKSWIASAWQADTIFGHLCWGMRYLSGMERLTKFLQLYEKGEPPLLISNGFPGDLLPRPVVSQHTSLDLSLPLIEQKKRFRESKETQKAGYLTMSEFNHAINGEKILPSLKFRPQERITLKNQINRLTSTTNTEGSLYNFEEYYWTEGEVTIYLKLADFFVDEARSLFQYIADTGYGKRKSIGYGQVELASFEPFAGFKPVASPNGFITLSNFVPSHDDPTTGSWRTLVKYGKMGEEFASGGHEFKKPLIMLEAGSTFYDAPCREYYGQLVKGLNDHYPSVQYAFALPVPMVLTPKSD